MSSAWNAHLRELVRSPLRVENVTFWRDQQGRLGVCLLKKMVWSSGGREVHDLAAPPAASRSCRLLHPHQEALIGF
jgi:hypothetical protein